MDPTREPVVGVGSVCRRQDTVDAERLVQGLYRLNVLPHGFGFKKDGLANAGKYMESADSMAWSSQSIAQPFAGHGKPRVVFVDLLRPVGDSRIGVSQAQCHEPLAVIPGGDVGAQPGDDVGAIAHLLGELADFLVERVRLGHAATVRDVRSPRHPHRRQKAWCVDDRAEQGWPGPSRIAAIQQWISAWVRRKRAPHCFLKQDFRGMILPPPSPMPCPLSTLANDEQGLYAALGQQPYATDLPSILADNAEDRGEQARADLLHQNARVALWELLRRRALTNAECSQILHHTENAARQISFLLGRPDTKAPLPDLLTEDGLQAQFAFARTLLAAYGLPTGSVRADDVQRRVQTDKALREQIESGRSLLLLVPRLPLAACTAALADGLRRNEHLLGLDHQPLHDKPVSVDPLYKQQPLEYLAPKQIAHDPDRWQTEQQWLAEKDMDILFVEPSPDVPAAARSRSAEQAWADRRPGEALLTPQAWCILFLTLLERQGCRLDPHTSSLLAGARFPQSNHPSSGFVPYVFWDPDYRLAYLAGSDPGGALPRDGARVASEGA